MTEPTERVPTAQPAPRKFHDGWWDKMIAAILEEFDGPPEERERGPGR